VSSTTTNARHNFAKLAWVRTHDGRRVVLIEFVKVDGFGYLWETYVKVWSTLP
jgi:hypothetical protein